MPAKSERLAGFVSEEILNRIDKKAERLGLSRSGFISHAIRFYFDAQEKGTISPAEAEFMKTCIADQQRISICWNRRATP